MTTNTEQLMAVCFVLAYLVALIFAVGALWTNRRAPTGEHHDN